MSVGQRTIWDPDRNWTHDLPNTGQALYSLSYKNSDCVIFYLVHLHVLHFITELKIHHLYSFIRFHGTFQRQMFFKILSFSTLKKENGVIGKENTKRKQFFHFITPCYSPQSLYCFIHSFNYFWEISDWFVIFDWIMKTKISKKLESICIFCTIQLGRNAFIVFCSLL